MRHQLAVLVGVAVLIGGGVAATVAADGELPLDLSVSVNPGAPDAAFNQMLMDDPGLHLPSGLWAIDAVLRYYPDAGCNGPETWAQATIIVSVQGEPWPSASPTASSAPG